MTATSRAEALYLTLFERLRDQLIFVQLTRNIIKYLLRLNADYSAELDQAPTYFNVTLNATVVSMVIRLHTFFDRRNQVSMDSFFDFVEEHIDLFSEEAYCRRLSLQGYGQERIKRVASERTRITPKKVQEQRNTIGEMPSMNLRIWRNQLLAHVDLAAVVHNKKLGDRYPIIWEEIDAIISGLKIILSDYGIAYNATSFLLAMDFEHEIRSILNAFREDSKRRKSQ